MSKIPGLTPMEAEKWPKTKCAQFWFTPCICFQASGLKRSKVLRKYQALNKVSCEMPIYVNQDKQPIYDLQVNQVSTVISRETVIGAPFSFHEKFVEHMSVILTAFLRGVWHNLVISTQHIIDAG